MGTWRGQRGDPALIGEATRGDGDTEGTVREPWNSGGGHPRGWGRGGDSEGTLH